MIAYSIACYLFAIGSFCAEPERKMDKFAWIFFAISPISVPFFIGFIITKIFLKK